MPCDPRDPCDLCSPPVEFCCTFVVPDGFTPVQNPDGTYNASVAFNPDCLFCHTETCETEVDIPIPCEEKPSLTCPITLNRLIAQGCISFISSLEVMDSLGNISHVCCHGQTCVDNIVLYTCEDVDPCGEFDLKNICVENLTVTPANCTNACDTILTLNGTFNLLCDNCSTDDDDDDDPVADDISSHPSTTDTFSNPSTDDTSSNSPTADTFSNPSTDDTSSNSPTADTFSNPPTLPTFNNPASIRISNSRNANPSPSTINVEGLDGTITKVTVTLNGFSHDFPENVAVMLVAPDGKTNTILMAAPENDICGNNLILTFDDAAANPVPNDSNLFSGTYRPTNHVGFIPYNVFPSSAPNPHSTVALRNFNGLDPNGMWRLFIIDVASPYSGIIHSGWSITITTTNCHKEIG